MAILTFDMKKNNRQSGISLTELLIVIGLMVILLGISVPTVQHLKDSFDSSTGLRHLINAALSNARAMAVREQAYTGVRFQQNPEGDTYMIFIVHDADATNLANGFRAVVGRNPMKLPQSVSVSQSSVVFSPSGKLTTHAVRVRNKDGVTDDSSNDTIFNTFANVNADPPVGQFVQDGGNTTSIRYVTISQMKGGSLISSSTEYISPYTGELILE